MAVAAATLFFSVQALAVQHLHEPGFSEPTCWLCGHTDGEPALPTAGGANETGSLASVEIPQNSSTPLIIRPFENQPPRAPPTS